VVEAAAPDLGRRLGCATRVGGLRRFPGHLGFLRQSAGDGWALVGDAGYFKDPLTAHGITDALRDAELLADTIGRGDPLARYQARRDELAVPFFEATDAVASLAWGMDDLKGHHLALSRAMSREVEAVGRLGRAPGRAA
jgi:flavin-dependent dehydrogenase